MTLGFAVADLLPRARGGGQLKMGLCRLAESEWLDPAPDTVARAAAFRDFPGAVQMTAAAAAPGAELAAMLGVSGGLAGAAAARHEDMCLLMRATDADAYHLVGAAVAWPSDWAPADKIGLTLIALHAPIHGYAAQLASGVDHFMASLRPGPVYGRANWFIAPTAAMRWVAGPPERDFAAVTPENAGETLFVRCERQTLRRLPNTGAILFTIGVYVAPLGHLPGAQVDALAAAMDGLLAGEGARRGAPCYAAALQGFAKARGGAGSR